MEIAYPYSSSDGIFLYLLELELGYTTLFVSHDQFDILLILLGNFRCVHLFSIDDLSVLSLVELRLFVVFVVCNEFFVYTLERYALERS